jgi:hypothetical protein
MVSTLLPPVGVILGRVVGWWVGAYLLDCRRNWGIAIEVLELRIYMVAVNIEQIVLQRDVFFACGSGGASSTLSPLSSSESKTM